MTAKELVTAFRTQGHTLKLNGEQLLFTASPQTISSAKRLAIELLREHKQDVIAFLISEERYVAPPSALAPCGHIGCEGEGCYKVGPDVWIHSPRSAYHHDRK